jgi:hypothetical protein
VKKPCANCTHPDPVRCQPGWPSSSLPIGTECPCDCHADGPPVCAGVEDRVPYYEVRAGRATCPVCGMTVSVVDDRDGSAFTVSDHWDTRRAAAAGGAS